jgi:hypothetical protein
LKISNVHHRNLIRLLGCCSKGPELLLVYEFIAIAASINSYLVWFSYLENLINATPVALTVLVSLVAVAVFFLLKKSYIK